MVWSKNTYAKPRQKEFMGLGTSTMMLAQTSTKCNSALKDQQVMYEKFVNETSGTYVFRPPLPGFVGFLGGGPLESLRWT